MKFFENIISFLRVGAIEFKFNVFLGGSIYVECLNVNTTVSCLNIPSQQGYNLWSIIFSAFCSQYYLTCFPATFQIEFNTQMFTFSTTVTQCQTVTPELKSYVIQANLFSFLLCKFERMTLSLEDNENLMKILQKEFIYIVSKTQVAFYEYELFYLPLP